MAVNAATNFDKYKNKTIPMDAKPAADMLDIYTYCIAIAENIIMSEMNKIDN